MAKCKKIHSLLLSYPKCQNRYKKRYTFCARDFYALVQNNKLACTKNYAWYIVFMYDKVENCDEIDSNINIEYI